MRKKMFSFAVMCFVILFCTFSGFAAVGDHWQSGPQFHSPAAGSPVIDSSNPLPGNTWQYGYRMAQGHNDGKWKHINAGPFTLFAGKEADELGPAVAGAADSGPDLNRWWVPFPPPEGRQHVGSMVYAEGAVQSGPENYLAGQVHLLTDDSAPINGIPSLLWAAPQNGAYTFTVKLTHCLNDSAESTRDPFYHMLVNGICLEEGQLKNYGEYAEQRYENLTLKEKDTFEVCASTGGVVFPLTILAVEVTVEQVPAEQAGPPEERIAEIRALNSRGQETFPTEFAGHPYATAMKKMMAWNEANLGPDALALPISLFCGGKELFRSSYLSYVLPPELLKDWKAERIWKELDKNRIQKTLTYTNSQNNLTIRLEMIEYRDFPVLEWTAYVKNNGPQDSPIIDNLLGLNVRVDCEPGGDFLLHHNSGSFTGMSAYAPFTTTLEKGMYQTFGAYHGRPSDTDMPYFNLELGNNTGFIFAIGWPGQWKTELMRAGDNTLMLRAGQQLTHFALKPGEEVRTPLTVLLFWDQMDWIDAQNIWRRWMFAHNFPQPGGEPLQPMLTGQMGFCMDWMYRASEQNQKEGIDRYQQLGIKLDGWWMDTGWYTDNWLPHPERFPNGIRPVSDYCHERGIKTILWFEAERVSTKDSWIYKTHPEWCLSATTTDQMLYNLGDPAACEWLTDHIAAILQKEGVDIYRSDFNMDPLDHWRQNEAMDRQGMIENHWVQGYLAFWDGLITKVPGLLIDACASGGRRNDLESMRRGVPFWKCDYAIEPVGMQCQTYGLAMWIPYYGNSGGQMDPYVFRSNMFPAVTKGAWEDRSPGHDIRQDQDYSQLLKMFDQWRQIAPDFMGDYYPLTDFSLTTENVWIGWQFHTPQSGQGFVQAFRRPGDQSPDTITVKLRGLDPQKSYQVTDMDNPQAAVTVSGAELLQKGIAVKQDKTPAAVLIRYEVLR